MTESPETKTTDYHKALKAFAIPGALEELEPYGNGHLNRTFRGKWRVDGAGRYYIHQIINHTIFTDVPALMHNVTAVTDHVRVRVSKARSADRQEVLRLVPLSEGGLSYFKDSQGNFWRTYDFVPDSFSYETCTGPDVAYECSRSFGNFNLFLSDLETAGLKVTIPHFIDTRRRYQAFENVLKEDVVGRAAEVQAEIRFIVERKTAAASIMQALDEGRVPWRVTHNDLKLNNLLFDINSKKGMCVVDLDTCMAGSWLYDFGDLVRTAANGAAEDEQDLQKVHFRIDFFNALAAGFAETLRGSLTEGELALIGAASKIITLHMAIRFLTDYLAGDVYYSIRRPHHNLDRCRTQLKLVEEMEKQEDLITETVRLNFKP